MVRYLHQVDHYPARIRKVDTLFGAKLDFEDTKFPVKIRAIFTNLKKRIAPALGSYESDYVGFENYEREIKPNFMIYVDFEGNLVPQDNGCKTQISLIWTNIQKMLPAVMAIN